MDRTRSRHTVSGPPNACGFVHKRIIGAVGGGVRGFLGGGFGGLVTGAAGGFVRGGGTRAPDRVPIRQPIPDPRSIVPRELAGLTPCPPGFAVGADGQCLATVRTPTPGFRGRIERILPGGRTGFGPDVEVQQVQTMAGMGQDFGDARVGRFGAGLEPAVRSMSTRICPRGAVLAIDGLCYNRRDLRNADRMWPRGRRPLLTGGEMRCITIASNAAKKLQNKQKQLRALGLLKAPARRRTPKALAPGHHEHVAHD